MIDADERKASAELRRMLQTPYSMDAARRTAVLAVVQERCQQHNWSLLAAHVRSSHVHIVVEAEARPEGILNDIKAYASCCLNRAGLDDRTRKRWSRHGSTRWLWKREDVAAAIRYVVDEQGDPMAVFEAAERM